MTPPRLTSAAAVLLAACGSDKVTLRYHPTAGTTTRYVVDQDMKARVEGGPMAGAAEQGFTMRLYITEVVRGPEAGGVGVAMTFDSAIEQSVTVKHNLTVNEIQISDADTVVLIGIQTTLPAEPVNVRVRGAPVQVRFSGGLTGELVFSLSRGRALSSTNNGTLRLTMTAPQLGNAAITMTLEQRATVRLAGAN